MWRTYRCWSVWHLWWRSSSPRWRCGSRRHYKTWRWKDQPLDLLCDLPPVWKSRRWSRSAVCSCSTTIHRYYIAILSVRTSVCPSVCHTGGSVKTMQATITKFSPSAARKTLVLKSVKFFYKFKEGHLERGRKMRGMGKFYDFKPISRYISETVRDRVVTINR